MELHKMIELAANKKGSIRNLAKDIGVSDTNLTSAKMGRRGLPAIACGKLADILEIDRWTVVAASELVTERSEEKRAYFSPFVLNSISSIATAIIALTLSTAQNEANANETFKVSATPRYAASLNETMVRSISIMSNLRCNRHQSNNRFCA